MRYLLLGLVTALWLCYQHDLFASPVPKELKGEAIPSPPQPDETWFPAKWSHYGIVTAVSGTRVTLKPRPNVWKEVERPGGEVVRQLVPVDETPRVYFVHPVMWDGGLADEAYGRNGYRVDDVTVGDLVDLQHIGGPKESRWLVGIVIQDRDKQGPPPPFRTSKEWDKIRLERHVAREARLKAKEAGDKK